MTTSKISDYVFPSDWMSMLNPDAEQQYCFGELEKRNAMFNNDVETMFSKLFWSGDKRCQFINIVAKCDFGLPKGHTLWFTHSSCCRDARSGIWTQRICSPSCPRS